MGHVHVHAPHELTEAHEESEAEETVGRTERLLELGAVLLLSLTTLLTAWSGYQAARWSGEQSQSYAHASSANVRGQQARTRAGQEQIADLLLFNGWLNARATGNAKLAGVYRSRFRPEFVPAFTAWLAQRPFGNPHAVPGPQLMSQYKLADNAKAAALEQTAAGLQADASDAKANDDHYILSTVFFAAVLFFAGISLRLAWLPLRMVVLGLAAAMMLGGAIFVLSLPVA